MTTYWDTAAAVDKSKKASKDRKSDRNGLGIAKHNSGQKSYMQIEQELTAELGRPATFGEVFIKAHTKKDGTYVDFKAEKVIEAYKKNKEEKLANLSTFCNDRGDLFGIGSLKKKLKWKRNDPSSSASFLHMQRKLEEAERKIEEQAVLIAKAEEDRARVEAANQSKMAEFTTMQKYILSTDPRYHAFIASEASSSPASTNQ
ncbi:uncharacterized protein LOC108838241 [Raphanus sativus]|uniref:Uncharacterized protein LOC108838241 n=1 Tax=Raphanus sativus TaxID=3726 RepID=A0A9W3C738_RAPSA|nr:uncharacterized protein LOC108838241 [Raphanus sativus]